MNAYDKLSLGDFLITQDLASASSAQPARYALRRAMLVSSGDLANTVCRHALQTATTWLGAAPPVAHWDVTAVLQSDGGARESSESVTDLLDHIARRRVADDLRAAGYDLQNPEELQVWVVASDQTGNLPNSSDLLNVGETLRNLAWKRLRSHVTLKCLAIVEPVDTTLLAEWHQQLQAGMDSVYLCSQVNLRHMRLDPADFEEQTAIALATLLCGTFPSHARDAGISCLTVGATAWTAPVAAIRRGLALLSALHMVDTLRSRLGDNAEVGTDAEQSLVSARIPTIERSDLELATAVTPTLPPVRWRDLEIGWHDLGDLRTNVQKRLDLREERHGQSLRAERHTWLDQRMELWGAILAELDGMHVADGDGPPPLDKLCLNLRTLDARLRLDLDELSVALERSERRLLAAEDQIAAAWERVEKLCAQLPPVTVKGLLLVAIQPWMWPIWPYALHVLLPQEGQKVLDGIAFRGKVRWHEANWHILRQRTLAMSQDVNQRLRRLHQVRTYMEQLRACLVRELDNLPLTAPWSQDALQSLWVTSLPQVPALAAFPIHENPITWITDLHEQCTERLVTAYCDATIFVERWTVLDSMAQPFFLTRSAPGATNQDRQAEATKTDASPLWAEMGEDHSVESPLPADCLKWLTGLVESAQPLWPDPAVTPQAGPIGWFMLPQLTAGVSDSGYGQDSILRWCDTVVNLSPATLAGRTLAILRWAPVEVGNASSNDPADDVGA